VDTLNAPRTALVFGVANDHSLAWAITRALAADGVRIGLAFGDERLRRRVEPLGARVGAAFTQCCDVREDAELTALAEVTRAAFPDGLDIIVHCVAYAERADLEGDFVATRRAGFATALDVSAFSLVAAVQALRPQLRARASILTLTFDGAHRIVPGYKVMGPAKAALEACVRALAAELGPSGCRVNALSPGPVRTLAAAGIPGFRDMMRVAAERAPLGRTVQPEEVAAAARLLLSPEASGITGVTLHVDAGAHILGA